MGSDVFVKLNHRSPKDVALENDNLKTKKLLRDNIIEAQLLEKTVQDKDHIFLWIDALVRSLRCSSGEEAMYLLTHSFRIKQDLSEDLQYPDYFKSKIIIRRWNELVDPRFEFRGFVGHNGEMTALSQYEAGIYIEDVCKHKQKYQDLILTFFNTNLKQCLLDYEQYVIDFVVCGGDTKQVFVVELNPFHANTSGCMFLWKTDRDLILHGPFTFRVEENPLHDGSDKIPESWAKIIQEYKTTCSKKIRVKKEAVGPIIGFMMTMIIVAAIGVVIISIVLYNFFPL